MSFDLEQFLKEQIIFSTNTYGPGKRTGGVIDHIRKELVEIEEDPNDLEEWVDVILLALDGAWRSGATPKEVIEAILAKTEKNRNRKWPDWRTVPEDKAIEHIKESSEGDRFIGKTVGEIEKVLPSWAGEAWTHGDGKVD